jgi:hypothetical protein
MNDGYTWWLVILGIGIGIAVVLLLAVPLRRREDDVTRDERAAEAAWISATIERDGGIAPASLVQEILELHRDYLGSGGVAMPAPAATWSAEQHTGEASDPARYDGRARYDHTSPPVSGPRP